MIFGISTLTFVHTLLSLIALGAGLVVVFGLPGSRTFPLWTALFLVTAILTDITGFLFPFDRFLPSHWFGVISLIALAVAFLARYRFEFARAWRWLYVLTMVLGTYLLAFVTVVQAFQKIPALHVLAPTQSELPFAVAQIVVLAIFVWLGFVAIRKFHSGPTRFA
jgi:magnesium-transporting ATPase (P-type)